MSIVVTKDGFQSVVTLNRPSMNLLDIETMDQLVEAHQEADRDPKTRVILTRSALPEVFSMGLDPKYVLQMPAEERVAIFRAVARLLKGLYTLNKPHIAVINGPAMAGGAVFAITADFRYFDSNLGRISFSEPKVGLPIPHALAAVIKLYCRPQSLRDVLFGQNLDAQAALDAGLADGIAAGELFEEMVQKQAARLERLSPAVCREIKKAYRTDNLPAIEEFVVGNKDFDFFVGDGHLGEGLKALVEKRFPQFAS